MSTPYHPFPQTHWSLVHRAANSPDASHHDALATLLSRYHPALRSYLRIVRRFPPDLADDLLQSFITDKFLERQLLQHADESRGRFRSFLLTCLNNFIATYCRTPCTTAQGLNPWALGPESPDPANPSPEAEVEAAWTRALLHDVLHAMKEECAQTHRMDVWTVFEQRILAELFDNRPPLDYEALARNLHLQSPTQAANLLVTAKRTYARLLRAAIAEYEPNPALIEEEIATLHKSLSRSSPTSEF